MQPDYYTAAEDFRDPQFSTSGSVSIINSANRVQPYTSSIHPRREHHRACFCSFTRCLSKRHQPVQMSFVWPDACLLLFWNRTYSSPALAHKTTVSVTQSSTKTGNIQQPFLLCKCTSKTSCPQTTI